MKSLDWLNFPLDSRALIEASAGTGKTYTIANLYLRYLLEKGYQVDQILVVTFTEAATQELRERIRARIKELLVLFEADDLYALDRIDPNLLPLLERSENPALDRVRLQLAAQQMDQAAIATIHSFCQSTLARHALPLGVSAQQRLEENLQELWLEQTRNFWRYDLANYPESAREFVLQHYASPESLHTALRLLIHRPGIAVLPKRVEQDWPSFFGATQAALETLQSQTREHLADLTAVLQNADLSRPKDKLKWFAQIEAWALEGEAFDLPRKSDKEVVLERYRRSRCEELVKKNAEVPEHPWFDTVEQTLESVRLDLKEQFLLAAFAAIDARVAKTKNEQGLVGFDDLISQVAQCVRDPERLPALQAAIADEYRCALIDEFQDTDAQQYDIFSRLFTPKESTSKTAPQQSAPIEGAASDSKALSSLVMIGDPKQAIYGFRGGDIATYLRAKDELAHVGGDAYTMATNWRSAPAMVSAVNAFFLQHDNPFTAENIPFIEVNAGQDIDLKGAALQFECLDVQQGPDEPDLTKAELDRLSAKRCADYIAELLRESACLVGDEPVKSRDFAILVRKSSEAVLMKNALAEQGLVASFEMRSKVFESEEAYAISALLKALLNPKQITELQACLALTWWGQTDAQLVAVNRDIDAQSRLIETATELASTWQKQGVMACLKAALERFEVLKNWRAQYEGYDEQSVQKLWERRLSNYLQLAEILQANSYECSSAGQLLAWFQQQLFSEAAENDETRLRLESDDELIKIVTIHKSKGLEYPYVFLPFVYSTRGAQECVFYQETLATQSKTLTLDLLAADEHKKLAEQERLAEDLRIFYVALTRAKYRCFSILANYESRRSSALGLQHTAAGYLLGLQGTRKLTYEQVIEQLDERVGHCNEVSSSWQSVAQYPTQKLAIKATEQDALLQHRVFDDHIEQSWQVQSFTGLAHQHEMNTASDTAYFPRAMSADASIPDVHILNFPKGARAGTFLHALFENLQFVDGELIQEKRHIYVSPKDFVSKSLRQSALVAIESIDAWAVYLLLWFKDVVALPVFGNASCGANLNSLMPEACLVEMDFDFTVAPFDIGELNHLLLAHTERTEAFHFSAFNGHLKGAIDLVCQADRRFYVVDYKSNHLGVSTEDYLPNLLAEDIRSHHYDLQYLIYTVALHRFLSLRLGEQYDYDQHFGGVCYLYLRGMTERTHQTQAGVYTHLPSRALIEALDALFTGTNSDTSSYGNADVLEGEY